jgi:hypothetical protein
MVAEFQKLKKYSMYYKLNEQGYYLGLKSDKEFEGVDVFQTNISPVGNFVKAKFDFELNKWVEGATEDEIKEYQKLITPEKVSKRQLKQALILSDYDLSLIDEKIAEIEDTKERLLTESFWIDSQEFERNHEILISFATDLGFTEEQTDDLFILANTL